MSKTTVKRKEGRRKNGMGSPKQLPSGRWQLKQQHGYNRNGNPRILTVTGTSETDCLRLMRKKIQDLEKEAVNASVINKMTLSGLCYAHFQYHLDQPGQLKPKGADRRESTIKNQIKAYDIGKLQVGSVKGRDIEDHIEYLIKNTSLSVSSITKTLDVINAAFKWAISQKYLTDNPCSEVIERLRTRLRNLNVHNSSDGIVTILSEEQIKALEHYIWSSIDTLPVYRAIFNLTVLLLIYTGMRVGELCALRWSCFNDETHGLNIPMTRNVVKNRSNSSGKRYIANENKVKNWHCRTIELSDDAVRVLNELRRISPKTDQDDYILINRIGDPSTPTRVDVSIRMLYRQLGFPNDISGAHVLRRTCATRLYDEGQTIEIIAAYLGDTKETILKHYICLTKQVKSGDVILNIVSLKRP